MDVTIDGIRYVPDSGSVAKIGVGITTRNRRDVFNQALTEWKRHLPTGAVLVVVDDASDEPVAEADFRFDKNVGIARSKNKALELLYNAGCQHMFLSDDDFWPVTDSWYAGYVESPEPHLAWLFDKPMGTSTRQLEILYEDSRHIAYHATRGCFLYVTREVLESVGGMNPAFGKWGWEHVCWSDRIHAAGWTTWRDADVKAAQDLFRSLDQENAVKSTVQDDDRKFSNGPGNELRMRSRHDDSYIEFRQLEDVVLTCLLTSQGDPQRGKPMSADPKVFATLRKSVGDRLVVLHTDLDEDTVRRVRVEQCINPYFERWLQYFHWLRDHPEVGFVWCVDATDVEMLRDPFPEMQPGTL